MKNTLLAAAMVTCALSAPIVTAQEESAPAEPMMPSYQGDPRRMSGNQGGPSY